MVKKLLCLMLALSLCIASAGISAAESVDVSALSDEDLLALRDRVLAEVALRHLDNEMAFGQWYDYGLGQYLPTPSEVFGREVERKADLSNNDDRWFTERLEGVTEDEFTAYVAALRMYGFNDNISASGTGFKATNVDGIKVDIALIGRTLYIDAKRES